MVHPVVVADECLPENPAASYLFLVDERVLLAGNPGSVALALRGNRRNH
jgi:hypothetical protein